MTNDDERQAALIKATISSYVGTATLAVLAGGVALFTYIQQNFQPSGIFYGLMVLAAIVLVLSFIFGGRGANTTAEQLAGGTWTKSTVTKEFNWQALLTLAGMIILLIATAVGTTTNRPASKDPCVGLLSRQLEKAHPNIRQLKKELSICELGRS